MNRIYEIYRIQYLSNYCINSLNCHSNIGLLLQCYLMGLQKYKNITLTVLKRPRAPVLPFLPNLSEVISNQRAGCLDGHCLLAIWHARCIMNLLPQDQGDQNLFWDICWAVHSYNTPIYSLTSQPWLLLLHQSALTFHYVNMSGEGYKQNFY